jgi:hypothetical protein
MRADAAVREPGLQAHCTDALYKWQVGAELLGP